MGLSCYLGEEVFEGPGCVMQPFDQQSQELFNGQTQTPDLIGPLASTVIHDVTRTLAIVLDSTVRLWNIKLESRECTLLI